MTFSWELNGVEILRDLQIHYYSDIFAKRIKIPCSFVFLRELPTFMSERRPIKMPKLTGGG